MEKLDHDTEMEEAPPSFSCTTRERGREGKIKWCGEGRDQNLCETAKERRCSVARLTGGKDNPSSILAGISREELCVMLEVFGERVERSVKRMA